MSATQQYGPPACWRVLARHTRRSKRQTNCSHPIRPCQIDCSPSHPVISISPKLDYVAISSAGRYLSHSYDY